MLKMKTVLALACCLIAGCTVISANRTFPKLAWYWSADAKAQRSERRALSSTPAAIEYPLAEKVAKRDGTNYIGVFLGMIAEHDGRGGVQMFSATSGECLRWISYREFQD